MRLALSIIFLAQVLPSQGIVVKETQQAQRSRVETCSPLKNHLTYSSVKVSIGTPPQHFHLVADTGSNNCIVNDCACTQCPKAWGNCFTGQKKSKSFDLPLFEVPDDPETPKLKGAKGPEKAPASLVMSFGSGDIAAQVASDEVGIGSVKTYMDKGLLLMLDQALNLDGPFEGILGLGRPDYKENATSDPNSISVPGFFDSAHIQRFSMCFNPTTDGVLGINTPEHTKRMSTVGKLHWGLDFHGISIGKNEMKVGFCDPQEKKAGMETACGIIPDSGTTLISGPEAQISMLFDALCKEWKRCMETHHELLKELKEMQKQNITISATQESGDVGLLQQDPEMIARMAMKILVSRKVAQEANGHSSTTELDSQEPESAGGFDLPKALTLQLLLEQCSTWSEEVDFNEELPPLAFHVAGAHGNKDELIITPRNYVLMRKVDVQVPTVSNKMQIPLSTKNVQQNVCMMAFNPSDYPTQMNGDVWIMGTPLFYEYTAHYDRGSGKEQDIGMGFTPRSEEDCGSCEGHKISRQIQSLVTSEDLGETTTAVGLGSLRYLDKQPVIKKPKSSESI
eukprot:Skav220801  [mRNA]  locus=scaffold150:381932:383632:+ [translate_table: standard]